MSESFIGTFIQLYFGLIIKGIGDLQKIFQFIIQYIDYCLSQLTQLCYLAAQRSSVISGYG